MFDYPHTDKKACKSMIESILCYSYPHYIHSDIKHSVIKDRYLKEYVRDLGEDVVLELIQEVQDSIDYIKVNVYTDCEGVTYNSIVHKGE